MNTGYDVIGDGSFVDLPDVDGFILAAAGEEVFSISAAGN